MHPLGIVIIHNSLPFCTVAAMEDSAFMLMTKLFCSSVVYCVLYCCRSQTGWMQGMCGAKTTARWWCVNWARTSRSRWSCETDSATSAPTTRPSPYTWTSTSPSPCTRYVYLQLEMRSSPWANSNPNVPFGELLTNALCPNYVRYIQVVLCICVIRNILSVV